MSIFQRWFGKVKKRKQSNSSPYYIPSKELERRDIHLSGDLKKTIEQILNMIGENDDLVIRRFHVFGDYPAILIYFSNIINQTSINEDILKPTMYKPFHLQGEKIRKDQLRDVLYNDTLFHADAKIENSFNKMLNAVLRGESAIVIDGIKEALVIDTRNVEARSVTAPETERVVRGPREGFIELLKTNIALLRYRLPTPDFRVKKMEMGRITKTTLAVCYIKGIANPALVDEVIRRLQKIDQDNIYETGQIEQYIQDHHLTLFPQAQNTERPDKTAAAMMEGRVVLILDGSPMVLIVPAVFSQFYQTVDDYTERFTSGSFFRMIRLVALIFSLIFPSLYVAIISFNPELIPTEFAVAAAGGRAGVPFPAVVEVLFIEIAMEVLREATIRMPSVVGGALSIVGVLIIGEAAVNAGFSSPITIVAIALTTIGSFATPAYNAALALRIVRFPLLILSGIFGLYGVMIGLILITNHLLSLKSFGEPYLSPLIPGNWEGMKDAMIRAPNWLNAQRPQDLYPLNPDRVGDQVIERLDEPSQNPLSPRQSVSKPKKGKGDDR